MTIKCVVGLEIKATARNFYNTTLNNIITTHNNIKLHLKNKGKKGKGRFCEAFNDGLYSISTQIATSLEKEFIKQYSEHLEYAPHILGEFLIGECQDYSNKVTPGSARHQINQIIMESKVYALCYQNPQYQYERPWTMTVDRTEAEEEDKYFKELGKERLEAIKAKDWETVKRIEEKLKAK